jgi:hypothetical protein
VSRLTIYESKVFDVIFAGFPMSDGRAETFFRIAPAGPAYISDGPGADGHITRCGTNNDLYVITLTYKGTSNVHAKLSAIHIADRISANGAGVAPFLAKDANGSTLIATDRCWIVQAPDTEFGVQRGDMAWELNAIIPPAGLILGGA